MTDWPLVAKTDDGIRPAGAPDECFYCRRKVGQSHALDCTIVHKLVEYKVVAVLSDGTTFSGLWQREEPFEWDAAQMNFARNDSSWCANNFLGAADASASEKDPHSGSATWDASEDGSVRWAALRAEGEKEGCLCTALSFYFVRVVDPNPRRALQKGKG